MGNLSNLKNSMGQGKKQPAPTQGTMGNATGLASGEKVDPKLEKQMEAYVNTLMHIMHSPETSDSVMEMLSGGPAEESIPFVANQLNDQVEGALKKKTGQPVDDAVKIAGAVYMVGDLAELGNAAGIFQIGEEALGPILQKTMQSHIQKGLRDGTIDPIELQQSTEGLLSDTQMKAGVGVQNELGLPSSPTAKMGMDRVVQNKVSPLEEENAMLKQQASISTRDQRVATAQPTEGGGSNNGIV